RPELLDRERRLHPSRRRHRAAGRRIGNTNKAQDKASKEMTARIIMKLVVADVAIDTPGTRIYTLRHPNRPTLPPQTPGAHVDVRRLDGKVRQYSLCGDPGDDTCYRIAVRREDQGRGGSRWLHENVVVGTVLHVSAPRNNFPLANNAERHIFIAGGIGITPFASMVIAARR